MPLPRPPYLPGNYYHFYNRGRSRLSIFHDEQDFMTALWKMNEYVKKFSFAMIAYCLEPNHYHFLTRQDGEPEARLLPQRVFNGYAKTYNNRYKHAGTIFEGEYRVKLVDNDRYLLHLCRYIHANPVKDGFAQRPEDWPYSNYRDWIGLRNGALLDRQFIQQRFATPETYQSYVAHYLRHRKLPVAVEKFLTELME